MKKQFKVKNWDEFQHYKDRTPPWIKLHNSLLDDYEFECLQDASKAHLLCIWMLASRTGNKMLFDNKWIERKIGANSKVNLNELLDCGFIELLGSEQDASNMLDLEEERRDREEENTCQRPKAVNVPFSEIVNLYNEVLTDLPSVVEKTEARRKSVKARWSENNDRKNLDWWRKYFTYISQSNFLMGRTAKPFTCNFDWIVNPTNMAKIIEGNYHNEQ